MEARMRRLLGLVLFFSVVVGGATSAVAEVGPLSRITGPSPFAPGCGGGAAGGTNYRNAEVEPWVDSKSPADPSQPRGRVAAGPLVKRRRAGQPDLRSYERRPVMAPSQPRRRSPAAPAATSANGGDYERASDPWVSIGPDGTAHQIALAINDSRPHVARSSSRLFARRRPDVGADLDAAAATRPPSPSTTRSRSRPTRTTAATSTRCGIACSDRAPKNPGSPFSGDTLFARSTDGGRTWEPTRTILDFPDNSRGASRWATRSSSSATARWSTSSFYLTARAVPFLAVQRSTDRGVHVVEPDRRRSSLQQRRPGPRRDRPVRRTSGAHRRPAARGRGRPEPGSETLHIVWQDIRFTLAAPLPYFNNQIVIASSTDGGLTWTDPKRVSENKLTQAFTGSVHVNERGAIGVTYYDFTEDDPSGGPLDTDYWVHRLARRRADVPASRADHVRAVRHADGTGRKRLLRGRLRGLTSVGRRFVPVFVTANDGNTANPTDAFSASVAPELRRHERGPSPRPCKGERPQAAGAPDQARRGDHGPSQDPLSPGSRGSLGDPRPPDS